MKLLQRGRERQALMPNLDDQRVRLLLPTLTGDEQWLSLERIFDLFDEIQRSAGAS